MADAFENNVVETNLLVRDTQVSDRYSIAMSLIWQFYQAKLIAESVGQFIGFKILHLFFLEACNCYFGGRFLFPLCL